jgi:hypothetical protein
MRLKRSDYWSDEEIENLRRMAAAELRVKAIAAKLRRRPEAVRAQARRSGIRFRETKLLEECLRLAPRSEIPVWFSRSTARGAPAPINASVIRGS